MAEDTIRLERDLYWRLLELGACEDLSTMLKEALALVVGLTRAEKGYIGLYEDDAGSAPRWWIAHGCSDAELNNIREKISHGIIGEAMATGKTILTGSALSDPRFQHNQSVVEMQIEAVLCAPIGKDEPIGVVYLQDSATPFTEEDRKRAEAFARHITPFVDRLWTKQKNKEASDETLPFRQRLKLESLIGTSRALADVFSQIEKAARFDITLLIKGASGTGKTALAKAIHQNSARADKPFVELNCAAIPENLFESELFGALPGSHSTATKKIIGKLAAAEGGTIFLDEVGELPLAVQGKLLQFLQSKEYFPLGGTKAEKADVRVITATNVDLEAAIEQKKFREDLYYRLKVMTIRVPSLSERKEDIALLLEHTVRATCKQYGLPALSLSPSLLRAAESSEWPGNIRQLAHAAEVAAINAAMESSAMVERKHLFPEEPSSAEPKATSKNVPFHVATRSFQQKLLLDSLEDTNWNVSETARRLELTRSHVHHLIQGFGIKRK